MIEPIAPMRWLFQPVTVPLVGFLIATLLPAGYFAKVARKLIERKLMAQEGN